MIINRNYNNEYYRKAKLQKKCLIPLAGLIHQ